MSMSKREIKYSNQTLVPRHTNLLYIQMHCIGVNLDEASITVTSSAFELAQLKDSWHFWDLWELKKWRKLPMMSENCNSCHLQNGLCAAELIQKAVPNWRSGWRNSWKTPACINKRNIHPTFLKFHENSLMMIENQNNFSLIEHTFSYEVYGKYTLQIVWILRK